MSTLIEKLRTVAVHTARKARAVIEGVDLATRPELPGHPREWAGLGAGSSGRDARDLFARHEIDLTAPSDPFDRELPARITRGAGGGPRLQVTASGEDGTHHAGWHTRRISTTGVEFNGAGEITSEEHNPDFYSWKVLGRSGARGHGLYHEMFVENDTYRRSWTNIKQALITGHWSVEPPELPDHASDYWRRAARERAGKIEAALFENLDGGWNQFCTNWLYALISGFSLFEEIYHGYGTGGEPGLIRELAFIYPSQVQGWVVNGGRLEAVYCQHADGEEYVLPARFAQLYSHDRFGNNFAGISPERSLVRWHQVLVMASRLEAISYERFGVPWITASKEPGAANFGGRNDDRTKTLRQILTDAKAEESPTIRLPDGTVFELHSPAGQMPDFDKLKRFCLERSTSLLKAEGSLIPFHDGGAYAARKAADDEKLQLGPYFAFLLAGQLNGANNTPYTGTVKKMEDTRWGGPLADRYCKVRYSAGKHEDPEWENKVNNGVQQGTIQLNRNVVERMHDRMDLDPPVWEGDNPLDLTGPAPDPDPGDGGDRGAEKLAAARLLAEEAPDPTLALGIFAEKIDEGTPILTAASASMTGCESSGGCGHTEAEHAQIREIIASVRAEDLAFRRPITAAEPDPDKANRELRQRQNQIAKDLKSVAVDHRRAFRQATTTAGVGPERARQIRQNLRQQFIPKYEAAMRKGLQKAFQEGAKRLVRDLGKVAPRGWDMPATYRPTDIIELQSRQAAREMFNRQQGTMMEQQIRNRRGATDVGLRTLSTDGAVGQVARKGVSAVYNAGRGEVMQRVRDAHERLGAERQVRAQYSSVLESGVTCEVCWDADGTVCIVGSQEYERISPPNICLGGDACKCIWVYTYGNEDALNDAFGQIGLL